ncbi:DinB family protein [Planctomyces sp. SH-PL62]|uniref:DinB family protein n=1 Tax=Planctomyces sp. SH-PL62 TaxID=1636152 RepID=UPI00078C7302|nr:DinB family protein [Planctomyces sp. SH-PL62]AMV39168.1 DinB family protein [Planctomyces sp. SH-PL62]
MSNPLADRFRRWFQYECNVHARVLASFESVPTERRESAEFRKAVDLMSHLVGARERWLDRIEAAPPSNRPLFPRDVRLDDVRRDCSQIERRWTETLEKLDDEALARVVTYQMVDGTTSSNQVEDLLVQLFGHSSYHRGQIAQLVRAAGGTPAETDFIHWVRDPGP